MKNNIIIFIMVLFFLFPEAKTKSADTGHAGIRPIVFGMTPVVGVESTRKRFSPLARFLSKKLHRPVNLLVTRTYGELIDKVQSGEVDLAKFSPLAYVRAKERISGLKLIASQVANGSVTYSSYIVSLEGNEHSSQKTISGARICFADPDSTSGYLFPLAWFIERNINPQRDLASMTFGGSHRGCIKGLFEGKWDLAATWAGAIRDARASGMDAGEMIIVAKTGRIPFDAWCLRPGLDRKVSNKITKTLLGISTLTQEGRRVLSPTLGINGWIVASDDTYDVIRKTIDHIKGLRNELEQHVDSHHCQLPKKKD